MLIIKITTSLILSAPLHECKTDQDCDERAKCDEGKCICQGKTTGNGKYCRGNYIAVFQFCRNNLVKAAFEPIKGQLTRLPSGCILVKFNKNQVTRSDVISRISFEKYYYFFNLSFSGKLSSYVNCSKKDQFVN